MTLAAFNAFFSQFLGGCLRETQNEISTHYKKNFVYITFHYGRNEMIFRFGAGLRKTTHPVKGNHPFLNEINPFADVSFYMILLWVLLT